MTISLNTGIRSSNGGAAKSTRHSVYTNRRPGQRKNTIENASGIATAMHSATAPTLTIAEFRM